MFFSHGNKQYKIEFSRARREVKVFANEEETLQLSKHPFTKVEIVELGETSKDRKIIATAEVGCSPEDKFRLEDGRLRALKKATSLVPKEMRKEMWEAYHGRKEAPKRTPSSSTPITPTPYLAMMSSFGEAAVPGWLM